MLLAVQQRRKKNNRKRRCLSLGFFLELFELFLVLVCGGISQTSFDYFGCCGWAMENNFDVFNWRFCSKRLRSQESIGRLGPTLRRFEPSFLSRNPVFPRFFSSKFPFSMWTSPPIEVIYLMSLWTRPFVSPFEIRSPQKNPGYALRCQ